MGGCISKSGNVSMLVAHSEDSVVLDAHINEQISAQLKVDRNSKWSFLYPVSRNYPQIKNRGDIIALAVCQNLEGQLKEKVEADPRFQHIPQYRIDNHFNKFNARPKRTSDEPGAMLTREPMPLTPENVSSIRMPRIDSEDVLMYDEVLNPTQDTIDEANALLNAYNKILSPAQLNALRNGEGIQMSNQRITFQYD